MKAHAFVDYLIDYDSINIYRVWNFEKNDVNDYKYVSQRFNSIRFLLSRNQIDVDSIF
jgi:hypothetical protein